MALNAPEATMAHRCGAESAATAFESAGGDGGGGEVVDGGFEQDGHRQAGGLFCTSMKKTATKSRSAVPGCATEILYR